MAIQLLEIEKELSGPDCRDAVKRYDAILLGLSDRISKALNEGVPTYDFTKTTALKDAVVLARKLIRLAAQGNV